MKAARKNRPPRGGSPILGLSVLHILNDGYLASLPLLLPFVQKDLAIDFGKIGLLTSLLSSAGLALALFTASISRAFGGYRVLVVSMFFYSAAFAITGISSGFYALAFAFAFASIGFGVFHPIGFALIAADSSDKELGNRMGLFSAVGDVGRIGISAFVTILVSLVNWRSTAFIYSVFPAVFAALAMAFGRSRGQEAGAKKVESPRLHGLSRSRGFIIALLTSFLDALASSSLFIFMPFLFIHRGASPALLGSLSGAFFLGNMLGKVVIGKITDRIGGRKVFVVSELSMAAILVILGLIDNLALIVAISILLGIVTKGTVPVINTLVAQAVPDRGLTQKAFGIVSFVNGIAAVAAPLLFGLLAQGLGIASVFLASSVFAFLAIVPLLVHNFLGRRAKA
jgi:MFS family permease